MGGKFLFLLLVVAEIIPGMMIVKCEFQNPFTRWVRTTKASK